MDLIQSSPAIEFDGKIKGSTNISDIRRAGKENVIVVATPSELAPLSGAPLLVDTGDSNVDKGLSGYVHVVTGYGRRAVYKVESIEVTTFRGIFCSFVSIT